MDELVQRLNAICDDQPYWTGWYLGPAHRRGSQPQR